MNRRTRGRYEQDKQVNQRSPKLPNIFSLGSEALPVVMRADLIAAGDQSGWKDLT